MASLRVVLGLLLPHRTQTLPFHHPASIFLHDQLRASHGRRLGCNELKAVLCLDDLLRLLAPLKEGSNRALVPHGDLLGVDHLQRGLVIATLLIQAR